MFLKSISIVFKIRRSKVTDYAALKETAFAFKRNMRGFRGVNKLYINRCAWCVKR